MLRSWRRIGAWLLLLFATLWAAAIIVAPRVVALGAEHRVWSDLGAVTYLVGGLICHQLPERSFHAAGVQYPVCARCTGIYFSAPIGAAAVLLLRRRASGANVYRRWRVILAVAVLPTLVSILLERVGGPTGLVSRAVAAVPLGVAAAAFVATAVLGHFSGDFTPRSARIAGPGSGV